MTNTLVSNVAMEDRVSGRGLLSYGMASPGDTYLTIFIWILSNGTTPQPSNVRGIWIDEAFWEDINYWYT